MANHRLPEVNGDDGAWGTILNDFLTTEHYNNDNAGAGSADSGGHQNVTLRAGTAALAPLTFANSTFQLASPVAGSVEFYNNRFYLTQVINSVTNRRTVAVYDDSSGAAGDIYYRDANANLVRLPIGGNNYTLTSNGSVPVWTAPGGSGLTQQQVMAISSMRI